MSIAVKNFTAAPLATLEDAMTMFRKKTSKDMVNPGNYYRLFAEAVKLSRNANGFTRDQLVNFAKTLKDKDGDLLTETAVEASVTVILSPRLESERGDCRGNMSAPGHLYFADKAHIAIKRFGKEVRDDKGELETEARFKMCMRETALAPLKRDGAPTDEEKAEKAKIREEKKAEKVKDLAAKKEARKLKREEKAANKESEKAKAKETRAAKKAEKAEAKAKAKADKVEARAKAKAEKAAQPKTPKAPKVKTPKTPKTDAPAPAPKKGKGKKAKAGKGKGKGKTAKAKTPEVAPEATTPEAAPEVAPAAETVEA